MDKEGRRMHPVHYSLQCIQILKCPKPTAKVQNYKKHCTVCVGWVE